MSKQIAVFQLNFFVEKLVQNISARICLSKGRRMVCSFNFFFESPSESPEKKLADSPGN